MRFLICGYAFVAIGCGKFFDDIVGVHMQRHYLQMGLLLHLELASLLAFSSQISHAVGAHESQKDDKNDVALEKAFTAIEGEFLQYVHRFHFAGVSNQVQAIELFEMWRKNLRTDEIFADVKEEIAAASNYLNTRAQRRAGEAAERISIVATIGVVVGIAIGVLGILFVSLPGVLGDAFVKSAQLQIVIAGITSAFLSYLSAGLTSWLGRGTAKGSTDRRIIGILVFLGTLSLCALIVALAWMFWPQLTQAVSRSST